MTDPSHAAHAATEITTNIYWLATGIFVLAYAVIVSEKIHKTKVALVGAALMMALPILTSTRPSTRKSSGSTTTSSSCSSR